MNTFQRLHTLTTISYNAKINRKSAGGSSRGQTAPASSTVPPAEKVSRGETPLPDAVDHHSQDREQEKENLPAVTGVKGKKHQKEKDTDPANKMCKICFENVLDCSILITLFSRDPTEKHQCDELPQERPGVTVPCVPERVDQVQEATAGREQPFRPSVASSDEAACGEVIFLLPEVILRFPSQNSLILSI